MKRAKNLRKFLSSTGIMYGGGDFLRAHSVDEFITVDELLETTQVFAGLVVELCA